MLHDRESHALGVASRLNPCAFHHEHYSAFGRARAMLYAVRNCESLIRRKLDRFVFQVDEQLARHHEEKLVLLVVVMPVKFTLNDTKSNESMSAEKMPMLRLPRYLISSGGCRSAGKRK